MLQSRFLTFTSTSSSSSSVKASASLFSSLRNCASSSTATTTKKNSDEINSTPAQPITHDTSNMDDMTGFKQVNLAETLWLQQQAPNELDAMWCSVPTLYRRLLKLYMKKFPDHNDVVVRAWKQTKFEFYHFRSAPPEDVPMLVNRGRSIHQAVLGGIIPVVQDPKTKLAYCKYDKETLVAAGGHIDPISAEEYMRRNKDKMTEGDRDMMRDRLKSVGRWQGSDVFADSDVPKLKTKKKKKCTDPDEE